MNGPDVVILVLLLTVYGVLGWIAVKIGVRKFPYVVAALVRRVLDGPQGPKSELETRLTGCELQRKIAQEEAELWGRIISPSVMTHLETCSKCIEALRADECKHEQIDSERSLDGSVILLYCTDCGAEVQESDPETSPETQV